MGKSSAGAPRRVGLLTSWLSSQGGGVAEVTASFARSLASSGAYAPTIIALSEGDDAAVRERLSGVTVVTCPWRGPRSFGFSPAMEAALRRQELDLLHLHGLWMWTSVVGARWASRTGKPYVVSPHGMLDPWILARSPAKKAVARLAYEDANLKRAALVHALNAAERTSIAAVSPGVRCEVIPNGIQSGPALARDSHDDNPYMLYLGRLHEKKNLISLVQAWAQASGSSRLQGFRMVIAGYGDDEYVKHLKAEISGSENASVSLVGPVYGAEKDALLSGARYLVLPSLSEGLPMSVLEAWSRGTPALLTDACNLEEGYAAGAALRIETTVDSIAEGLRVAAGEEPETWLRRSKAASALARGTFSEEHVLLRWRSTYDGLLDATRNAPA